MATVRRKRKAPAKRGTAAKRTYWSGRVTRSSNALDLRARIFTSRDPRRIALSLKRSAESSKRRKSTPYQSAMSMLTFYINRAGKALPARQKAILQRAKQELRKAFGRA
jgi:putative cell wall-binding protein